MTTIMDNYFFIGMYLNDEYIPYSHVYVKGDRYSAIKKQDDYRLSDWFVARDIVEVTRQEIDEIASYNDIWNQVSIEE